MPTTQRESSLPNVPLTGTSQPGPAFILALGGPRPRELRKRWPCPQACALWACRGWGNATSLSIHGSVLKVILSSFYPISVPFGPGWQCFCWYRILSKLVGLSCNTWGLKPPDKRALHRFFLHNHISVSGFCLDGWLDPWVTCLISLVNSCPVTPVALILKWAVWIG